MIIFIYWLLLFIFEVVLFVFSLKKNDKYYWRNLYKSIILSLGSIIIFELLYYILDKSKDLEILVYIFIGIIFGALTGIILIASLIINKVKESKITDNKEQNKVINKLLIVFYILCVLSLIISLLPPIYDIYRRVTYSKDIEQYLTEKYGDGNFKVIDIYDERSSFMGGGNNYQFTITSSYISGSFKIEMDIDTKEVESDNFINAYVMDKNICRDGAGIDTCLDDYITEKINKKFTRQDIYNAELSIHLDEQSIDEKFGKIPELEDLEKYTKISFNNFMIEKELQKTDEEELQQILIDMYNDYTKYLEQYNENNNKTIIKFKFKYVNPFSSPNYNGYNPYEHDGYIKQKDNEIMVFYQPRGITLDVNKN